MFIANNISKKLHKPDCEYADLTVDNRRMDFNTLEEAIDEGYKVCRKCFLKSERIKLGIK